MCTSTVLEKGVGMTVNFANKYASLGAVTAAGAGVRTGSLESITNSSSQ